MKKLCKLFTLAASTVVLGCSSSETVGAGTTGGTTSIWVPGVGGGSGNAGLGGNNVSASVPGLTSDNPGGVWVVPPDATPTKPGKGTGGQSGTAAAGGSTAVNCAPGAVGAIVTDCGYPYASSNPLTSVTFNESEVLRAVRPSIDAAGGVVSLLYGDEHAMTLGVRRVVVTGAAGSTTTDYPVSPLAASPDHIIDPQTGASALLGDQSGLDPSLRPLWPVLYVTDVTKDPASRAGDWQMGGWPINPNAVFGTWKSAVRTVDNSTTPPTVSITPDVNPAKNDWNLTINDPVPSGVKNEGYSAEVRWGVRFQPGHSYRLQVLVHDGDQNKVGGDSGEACIVFCAGGSTTPPPTCPTPGKTCGEGRGESGDYLGCPEGESCLNGCCTPLACPSGVTPCGPLGAEGEIVGCPSGQSCVSGCCLYTQPIP
jgi:hypothetical protein